MKLKLLLITKILISIIFFTLIFFDSYIFFLIYPENNLLINLFVSLAFLIICILLFILIQSKISKIILGILLAVYYFINFFLLQYHLFRTYPLDIYFVWYNREDIISTLQGVEPDFNARFTLIIIFSILQAVGMIFLLTFLRTRIQKIRRNIYIKSIVIVAIVLFSIMGYRYTELIKVLNPLIMRTTNLSQIYHQHYQDSINKTKLKGNSPIKNSITDNIFFIQLESVNAELVNEKNTPALLSISKDNGILFPKIQGGSMMTIRAQEVILCGILPPLHESLSVSRLLSKDMNCLPRILKQNGYTTLFFQSYGDLSFAKTDRLMKEVGFDEVHAADIIHNKAKTLKWGYDERVFYQEVFNYLKRYKGQKIFVYIAVSSSNHYPFYNSEERVAYAEVNQNVPYINSQDIGSNMENSLFIQDQFFGEMYRRFYNSSYSDNSFMIVLGDHSWPIGIHPNNYFNESNAFQENFVSTLAFIPPKKYKDKFQIGKVNTSLRSHMDILPTLLELLGIRESNSYGKSFFLDLLKTENKTKDYCLVSTQPFSGAEIAVVNYPIKYIFDIRNNQTMEYNIENDPFERKELIRDPTSEKDREVLINCLESRKKHE